MIRLFVGLELPAEIRARLAGLASGLSGAKWVAEENFHINLRFIGEVGEGQAADIEAALTRVRAPGFALKLEGLDCFGSRRRPRVLWVGIAKCAALDNLQAAVESALVRAGLAAARRKFKPHVTLARFKGNPPPRLGGYLSANARFGAGSFGVESFVLFSSFLKPEGPLYRAEAIYPLAGA